MKKLAVFCIISLFSLSLRAQKKSGAIQFETQIDPVASASANGFQMSDEMKARLPKSVKANFELLFTATHASYMAVQETEDSNGGGSINNMILRFSGAGNKEFYYAFADQKLTEVSDLNDTTFAVPIKLKVDAITRATANNPSNQQVNGAIQYLPVTPEVTIVKTEEIKQIIGLNCYKTIIKVKRKAKILDMEKDIVDETILWYTKDLGFDFSPNPNLWTEGAVLAIESRGNTTIAKSVDYRNVSQKDVTAPKKTVAITQEQYEAKTRALIQRRMGRARQSNVAPRM
jgi:hypothetical protein